MSQEEDEEYGRWFAGTFRGQGLRMQGEIDQLAAAIAESPPARFLLALCQRLERLLTRLRGQ